MGSDWYKGIGFLLRMMKNVLKLDISDRHTYEYTKIHRIYTLKRST